MKEEKAGRRTVDQEGFSSRRIYRELVAEWWLGADRLPFCAGVDGGVCNGC